MRGTQCLTHGLPTATTDWGCPLPPGDYAPAALLVLHGDADRVVSVRNATATALLWAQASGARADRAHRGARGQRYPMRAVDFKLRGQLACRCAIARLDHAWSGGASRWPYSDPAGPDASALIWAFCGNGSSRKFEENGRFSAYVSSAGSYHF